MIHFRIIGSIWLVCCFVPAVKFPIDLWSMTTHHQHGLSTDAHGVLFWIFQFFVEVSFLLILIIGWGLLRLRRWAAVGARFVGVIALVVCLWFILTQGVEHEPEFTVYRQTLPQRPGASRGRQRYLDSFHIMDNCKKDLRQKYEARVTKAMAK